MRLPWRPREYMAVVAALREAEAELARSDAARHVETNRTRGAQAEVRRELTKRKRGHR